MWWLIVGVVLLYLTYVKFISPLQYWKKRRIIHKRAWPIIGNSAVTAFRKKSLFELVQDAYRQFPDQRYNGFFQLTQPFLVVRDVDLIKQLTVKDFDFFTDHNRFVDDEVEPLMGKNLFSLRGQTWRDMRATLSPAFTSSKMRGMFVLMSECAEQFTDYFVKKGEDTIAMEMKDTFCRFANDVIASTAFGVKCDSLKDRDNVFFLMGKEATNFGGMKFLLMVAFPTLMKFLKITFFSRKVRDFFTNIVTETIATREKEGIIRHDMLHLLMEARKGKLKHEEANSGTADSGFATVEESNVGKVETHKKLEMTDVDMTAQALIFFFGGFDTTSTLMSFMAHELAVNPDVQEKVQKEIDETLEKCNGKITYEAVLGMKYLDMVISETLRKWPPGFVIDRVCVKDYTIPPKIPEEKPVLMEKDSLLMVPVAGIHHDPKYFPNPEKFDPERFSDEKKHTIVPGSYMPFGVGPRNCIASRFALLENKTLFCHLLAKLDIVVVEETEIPIKLSASKINMQPDKGFWLGLRTRKQKN